MAKIGRLLYLGEKSLLLFNFPIFAHDVKWKHFVQYATGLISVFGYIHPLSIVPEHSEDSCICIVRTFAIVLPMSVYTKFKGSLALSHFDRGLGFPPQEESPLHSSDSMIVTIETSLASPASVTMAVMVRILFVIRQSSSGRYVKCTDNASLPNTQWILRQPPHMDFLCKTTRLRPSPLENGNNPTLVLQLQTATYPWSYTTLGHLFHGIDRLRILHSTDGPKGIFRRCVDRQTRR
jgi:hypothetical protein